MCDFSVVAERQRDYRSGETLVITQLGHYTRGTTSPGDPATAVCLRSGACLKVQDLPRAIRWRYDLSKGEVSAIFMQLPNRSGAHRDALFFPNGRTILVNELPLGLILTVHQDQPQDVRDVVIEAALVRV